MASPAHPQVDIPPDEIAAALRSAAVPGFTGSVTVEILVKPEAVECLSFRPKFRSHHKANGVAQAPAPLSAVDPTRAKPVQSCIASIRSKLILRSVLLRIEANFCDGVLQNWVIEE